MANISQDSTLPDCSYTIPDQGSELILQPALTTTGTGPAVARAVSGVLVARKSETEEEREAKKRRMTTTTEVQIEALIVCCSDASASKTVDALSGTFKELFDGHVTAMNARLTPLESKLVDMDKKMMAFDAQIKSLSKRGSTVSGGTTKITNGTCRPDEC